MTRMTSFCLFILTLCILRGNAQTSDPVQKLGAFLGHWQSQGTMGGDKVTSNLECRWSPQGNFLVCEQQIKMSSGEHRQITVYSYNSKEGAYGFVTIPDPGGHPTDGKLEIKGNIWLYPGSYKDNGKTIQIKTTNTFTDSRTVTYKTETSEDGGATWKTILQGSSHKVGD